MLTLIKVRSIINMDWRLRAHTHINSGRYKREKPEQSNKNGWDSDTHLPRKQQHHQSGLLYGNQCSRAEYEEKNASPLPRGGPQVGPYYDLNDRLSKKGEKKVEGAFQCDKSDASISTVSVVGDDFNGVTT